MASDDAVTVVCVDGDEASLDRTVTALEADGRFLVRRTTDPNAVVGLVAQEPIDCVVSEHRFDDAEPGDVDAISLLQHVRSHAPDIAFVLYTDAGSEAVASAAIAAGVTDYVVKPADEGALADRVAGAVDTVEHRVVAHDRLREHRRFVDDALDTLDDVFYVMDTEGRMIQWNQRFNELFGYSDSEIAGMRAWEFVAEEDQPAVTEAIGEVIADGEATAEVTATLADGSRVRLDLHGRRLTDADGNVVGLCGIGRDVTERERTEWRLRTQNERLEEFASVLSHDLRNPLAVADGYLQLAREEGDLGYLEHVTTAHERMARLIDDVLTTARQGQTVEETEALVLEEAAVAAWNSVDTGDATLEFATDRVLQADRARVQRLLENLFRNSVEHGGSEVTVTVGDTPDGFFVADDGPGIPEDFRERAFEVGVTTGDGTGFGLSIVRSLAQAHGWAVSVVDADGGGARFDFTNSPTSDDD